MTTYDIITDLSESRLIPTKGRLNKYTAEDVATLTFLYLLAIEIMYSEYTTSPEAIDYITRTMQYGNFDTFRFGTNDLYVLIHTLVGKNNQESIEKLGGDPEDNNVFIDSLNVNVSYIRRHFMMIRKNVHNTALRRRFLIKMQEGLRISTADYRNIRVLVADWESQNKARKGVAMTRLLMAFRYRALRSDLLPILKQLANREGLIVKTTKNPETDTNPNDFDADNPADQDSNPQPRKKTPWWLKAAGIAAAGYGGYKLGRSFK